MVNDILDVDDDRRLGADDSFVENYVRKFGD